MSDKKCTYCGGGFSEIETEVDAGCGEVRHAHCEEIWSSRPKAELAPPLPNGYPMSAPDVQRLNDLADHHRQLTRFYHYGNLVDRIVAVIKDYEQKAVDTLNQSKSWRDDMIVMLRAMSMILEMVGQAGTHREKEARLRGCVEMIETNIRKMQDMTFEVARFHYNRVDLFSSDYPVRSYMDRIRELEHQLEQATGSKENKDTVRAVPGEDTPF